MRARPNRSVQDDAIFYLTLDKQTLDFYKKNGRAKTIKWLSKEKGYTIQAGVNKLNSLLELQAVINE